MKKVVILGCENSHADMFLRFISSNKKYSDVDVTGVFSYDAAAMDKLVARYGVKAMKISTTESVKRKALLSPPGTGNIIACLPSRI